MACLTSNSDSTITGRESQNPKVLYPEDLKLEMQARNRVKQIIDLTGHTITKFPGRLITMSSCGLCSLESLYTQAIKNHGTRTASAIAESHCDLILVRHRGCMTCQAYPIAGLPLASDFIIIKPSTLKPTLDP